MKKAILFILVSSILLVGCGYEFKKKGKENRTTTVHISDAGAFTVKGEVKFMRDGIIRFEERKGIIITTHISRCIIVNAVPSIPQAAVPPAPPVKKPTTETKPKPEKEK